MNRHRPSDHGIDRDIERQVQRLGRSAFDEALANAHEAPFEWAIALCVRRVKEIGAQQQCATKNALAVHVLSDPALERILSIPEVARELVRYELLPDGFDRHARRVLGEDGVHTALCEFYDRHQLGTSQLDRKLLRLDAELTVRGVLPEGLARQWEMKETRRRVPGKRGRPHGSSGRRRSERLATIAAMYGELPPERQRALAQDGQAPDWIKQIRERTDCGLRTAQRDWVSAKRWLRDRGRLSLYP